MQRAGWIDSREKKVESSEAYVHIYTIVIYPHLAL